MENKVYKITGIFRDGEVVDFDNLISKTIEKISGAFVLESRDHHLVIAEYNLLYLAISKKAKDV